MKKWASVVIIFVLIISCLTLGFVYDYSIDKRKSDTHNKSLGAMVKSIRVYHLKNGVYCYKENDNLFFLSTNNITVVSDIPISNAVCIVNSLWISNPKISVMDKRLLERDMEDLYIERSFDRIEDFVVTEEIIENIEDKNE